MGFRMPDLGYLKYEIKEWWERLAIREWINRNPKIIIGITGISVSVLLVILVDRLIPNKAPKIEEYKKAWFYDLNTGKLFVAESDEIPPIKAPSGELFEGESAGVKAYLFSFSSEPNESSRFIGFLEKFTPEAKKHLSDLFDLRTDRTEESIRHWNQGRLICRVPDRQWFPANSKEGEEILEQVLLPNENGKQARYCPPD